MSDIIFVGSSLAQEEAKQLHPNAQIMDPVRRGELKGLVLGDPDTPFRILVVDGIFSGASAPSPSEFADLSSRQRVSLYGCSSMGAVRAVECEPAGMRGTGTVFHGFRSGILRDDTEVAVAVDPDSGFRSVTVALVDIRWYIAKRRRSAGLSAKQCKMITEEAERIHFLERSKSAIRAMASASELDVRFWDPLFHSGGVKRLDAIRAIRRMAASTTAYESTIAHSKTIPGPRPLRYIDPIRSDPTARTVSFLDWFIGSGKYQHWLWPIVIANAGLVSNDMKLPNDTESSRAFASRVMRGLIALEADTLEPLVIAELEYMGDYAACRFEWIAELKLAAECESPSSEDLAFAKEEIAIAHGFDCWAELRAADTDGLIYDFLPTSTVEQAVRLRGAARTAARALSPRILR